MLSSIFKPIPSVCVCVCAYCVAGSGKMFGGWEAGIRVGGGGCVEWGMVGRGCGN